MVKKTFLGLKGNKTSQKRTFTEPLILQKIALLEARLSETVSVIRVSLEGQYF